MARYIKLTDDLLQELIDACNPYTLSAVKLRGVLENTPTEDVAKVEHGTWESVQADVLFECSICGCGVSTSWDYENDDMFTYCPCCGAKMDGGKTE